MSEHPTDEDPDRPSSPPSKRTRTRILKFVGVLVVLALLYYSPMMHDNNFICTFYGGQTMCNHQRSAVFHYLLKSCLNVAL